VAARRSNAWLSVLANQAIGLVPLTVYLLLLLAFLALTYNLVSSWVGRSLAAVRDSDLAAEAVGVSSRRTKLLAFALSSFYVGVEGALLAQLLGHVEPQNFTITESLTRGS
jgi:branched-chain amino acid transport system permease protein